MNYKKIGLGLAPIILILIIGFLGFNKYQEIKKSNFQAIQAIPNNASIIIKSNDWNSSWKEINNSNLWNKLTDAQPINQLVKEINLFSTELDTNVILKNIFNDNTIYFSMHNSEQDYMPFFAILIEDSQKDFLTNYFLQTNYSERSYSDVTIYTSKKGWNLSIHKNIAFISPSPLLIEQSIRQLNNELSLADDNSFKRLESTESSFANSHFYVNYKQLANLLDENIEISSRHKIEISRWANWAELDFKVKDNTFLFNGFTLAKDSSSNYLTTLRNQEPVKIEFSRVAPSNTSKSIVLALSDFNIYYKNYKEFLAKHNNLYDHSKWLQDIQIQFNVDIVNTFNAIIENEIIHLTTHSSDKDENYILIESKKESTDILQFIAESTNGDTDIEVENYRNYKLINLNLPYLFPKLFGPLFDANNCSFFTWIDGYLVFAQSQSALKTFINNFMSGSVLERNSSYSLFSQNLFGKSNFLYYTNPAIGNWKEKVKTAWKPFVISENWSNVSGFAYQLSANNELFNNNVVLNFEENLKKQGQLNWSLNLDNSIILKPQILINHRNKQNEVFTQDIDNKIYLISSSGKILWSKKIGSKILGDVNQIDFYKNNKLQILFNTSDSLFLIDRNGNNVENYPIPLKIKATSGHKLLDYDNTKKYRILVSNEQNDISNYDKYGNIVSGWKHEPMEDKISRNLKYIVYKGKDYIYVVDDSGNAKIVGRNGKTRVNLGNIPLSDEYFVDQNFAYVYSSDKDGNIWATDLNQKQSKIHSNSKQNHYFLANQMNEDKIIEFMVSNNEVIECFQGESLLFRSNQTIDLRPACFNFKNNYYLGISGGEFITILDNNGKKAFGTPVYGQGEFNCVDLEKDGQLNLIVGNNKILYNYSLE